LFLVGTFEQSVDVAPAVRHFFFQPSDVYSEESEDDSDYSEYSEDSESEGKMCVLASGDELSNLFPLDLLDTFRGKYL
jgi:hypothetical protein